MDGQCRDNNKKTVIRVYKNNELEDNFRLCKTCSLDPDFDGYLSETKIEEIIPQ